MEDLRELPPGTVAIYTLVGEDKYRAILGTPDVQKAYEYPIKAADLNQKVLEFRQVPRSPRLRSSSPRTGAIPDYDRKPGQRSHPGQGEDRYVVVGRRAALSAGGCSL